MGDQLIGQAIGVFIGGLITWLVSRFYYTKAADELCVEAGKLREETLEIKRLTNIVLRGLENAGILSVKREHGKIVGLFVDFRGKAEMKTATSNADISVEKVDDNKKNED